MINFRNFSVGNVQPIEYLRKEAREMGKLDVYAIGKSFTVNPWACQL
jgi:hypothetical protein